MKDKIKIADISKKILPLADRVVIKEHTSHAEKKTSSGIIIPAQTNEDKQGRRGEVVAIGPGRIEDGEIRPLTVAVGDTVIFQWGDQVAVEGVDYYIVRESEILAIIR